MSAGLLPQLHADLHHLHLADHRVHQLQQQLDLPQLHCWLLPHQQLLHPVQDGHQQLLLLRTDQLHPHLLQLPARLLSRLQLHLLSLQLHPPVLLHLLLFSHLHFLHLWLHGQLQQDLQSLRLPDNQLRVLLLYQVPQMPE